MLIDVVSSVARNLVPIGLIVALLIFAEMAIRGRTLRSLRTQLSIFVLVWIAAELPRSLIVIGFIRASEDLRTFGLVAHTISMVLFGVVLVLQFYKVPIGGSHLLEAIDDSLNELLGKSAAKAVKFYVEPSIATTNITEYSRSLRKIFLDGGKLLETRIAVKLYEKLGLQFTEKPGYGLVQYVQEAQTKRMA